MEKITIKNAYENNLKHLNLEIPLNEFTCVTGCSGCGKSSLVFETIYAESQRAFLEGMTGNIYGQKLSYQRREGILWVNGVSCKVKEDLRDLSIIVDREILEVAANEDTLLYFFETDLQELAGKISVEADQKVDSCLWKIQ